jgi:simple sugar transport system substrate-binding protein
MTGHTLRRLLALAAMLAATFLIACGSSDDSGGGGSDGASTTAAGGDDIKIVVVSHGQAADPFHSIIKRGAEAAGEELGADVTYKGLERFDIAKMVQNIDAAIATKPDGLVVSYPDADAIGPKIEEAVKAGIPVVVNDWATTDNPVTEHGALAYVGSDEDAAGRQAGVRLREAGVTHALCVNPELGNVVLDVRCNGFAEGLGGKSDVLGVDLNDPTAIQQRIEAALSKNSDIDGIITLWAQGSDSAIAALEKTGKDRDVQLATFDLSPEALANVRDGKIRFAIDQQPWMRGYLSVMNLIKYAKYGVSAVGPVPTGPMFITSDNAAQVIELSKQGLR